MGRAPSPPANGPAAAGRPRRISVFGNANLEVVIPAGPFPITYEPDRTLTAGQISVGVSGTAYNEAIALWKLGSHVELCVSHAAGDPGERLILNDYRGNGPWQHDPAQAARLARGCDLAVIPIGGANTRLAENAGRLGVPVASDVHAIPGLDGPHEPYCQAADLLFLSDERLPGPAAEWLDPIMARWPCRIAVVGQGARVALMAVRGDPRPVHVPAVTTGPVVSTLGAGDALCAAFIDGYTRGLAPGTALRRAVRYASAKLAHVGGAQGLLTAEELDQLEAPGPLAFLRRGHVQPRRLDHLGGRDRGAA